jgi:hypothetical protein
MRFFLRQICEHQLLVILPAFNRKTRFPVFIQSQKKVNKKKTTTRRADRLSRKFRNEERFSSR